MLQPDKILYEAEVTATGGRGGKRRRPLVTDVKLTVL